MVKVHPRWRETDLALQGQELQRKLGSSALELLHADGNLIWGDQTTVYRLSHPRNFESCRKHVNAVRALLDADPTFPTAAPTGAHIATMVLPNSGTWVVTTWHRVRVTPENPNSVDAYRALGTLLRRLHTLRIPGLARHDPLQWARQRVEALGRSVDVTQLRQTISLLTDQYEAAFPAGECVTVHGDVHWHQVGRDVEGALWLLDFESIALGHPSVDLEPSAGWARRTGLPSATEREALQDGYGEPWPAQTPEQSEVARNVAEFELDTWLQARRARL